MSVSNFQDAKPMSITEGEAISAMQTSIILNSFHHNTPIRITEAEAILAMQTSIILNSFHHNTPIRITEAEAILAMEARLFLDDNLLSGCFHTGYQPSKQLYYGTPIGDNLLDESPKDEKTLSE